MPLCQFTVPPWQKLAIESDFDFVPVLPLHFLSLTLPATLPLTLVQVIVDFFAAPAGPADSATAPPIGRASATAAENDSRAMRELIMIVCFLLVF